MRGKIEKALTDLKIKIEKISGLPVKTIQILIPDSPHKLDTIERHWLTDNSPIFNKAVVDFITDKKTKTITKSLFYLMYIEPFRYESYNQAENSEINLSYYSDKVSQHNNPNLSHPSNLNKFWKEWVLSLKSNKYGCSTLWSYINLPYKGSNVIFSGYVVFDGQVKDEVDIKKRHLTLSHINKIIQDALFEITSNVFFEDIIINATRAAISQVMARNMSHNLGSHVLSKFKHHDDILNLLDDGQFKEPKIQVALPMDTQTDANKVESAQLIAIFNDYLKSRMDFLADVTMADPILETPYKFMTDVLGGFFKNRILLNRISGISGIPTFEFKVETSMDGEAWYPIVESNKEFLLDNYHVAMPNDVLGCHALYVILENVIRNTYKHSKSNVKGFVFTIRITPSAIDTNLYRIQIYDNNCLPLAKVQETVDGRNKAFNEELLKDGKLRSGNLGTIEMEVCASYLRKIPLSNYQDDIYEIKGNDGFNVQNGKKIPNIIRAYPHVSATDCDCAALGYEFYLLKPKEVLIVSDTITGFDEWKNKGIDTITIGDFPGHTIYPHQIILCEKDVNKNIGYSPRILKISSDEVKEKRAQELIYFAWEKYREQLAGSLQHGYAFEWGTPIKWPIEQCQNFLNSTLSNIGF